MGRGKLPLRLIEKERARRITCMKRKKGLMKKAYELSTLCDIRVCMIIYDSAAEEHGLINTYPEDPNLVDRIIDDYRNYKIQNPSSSKRDLNLTDFYNDRIKKLKAETEKLVVNADNNVVDGGEFSVWDSRIDHFTESQLLELLLHLDGKIEQVNNLKAERTAMIVCENSNNNNNDHINHHHHQGLGFVHNDHIQDHPCSSSNNAVATTNNNELISPGFDQTMPFDYWPMNPWSSVMHYYTNLLEAPDHSCPSDQSRTAEMVLQPTYPIPALPGQMQYFPAGMEQYYHVQAPAPNSAIGSAGDREQFYGGSQQDAKFYVSNDNYDYSYNNNVGFGRLPGV